MAATDGVLRSEVVAEVAAEIRARLGGKAAAVGVEEFARHYLAGVAVEDLRARSTVEWVGSALNLWLLGKARQPGQASVRVYNPNLEDHGWSSRYSVVEMVNDDMPFLVDSVSAELNQSGHEVRLVIHPIVKVRRDAAGQLLGLDHAGTGTEGHLHIESMMHFDIDRVSDPARLAGIEAALQRVLALVRGAVRDWQPMRDKLAEILADLERNPPPLAPGELAETAEFLRWLDDDNFTYLGYREYDMVPVEGGTELLQPIVGSGLGILRDELRLSAPRPRELTREMVEFARRPEPVFVTKTNRRSQVHRPTHMDYIGIKRFDAAGKVVGERRFQGLFTSISYRQLAETVPMLGRKVRWVLDRAGFPHGSHDAKALAHILETMPRDELFQISATELYEMAIGIMQVQERHRFALFVRKDTFERFVACLVFVPRDRYSTELRKRMERILEQAFNGEIGAAFTHVDQEPLARVQFFLSTKPGQIPAYNVRDIEAALADATRGWSDGLAQVLVAKEQEERAGELLGRYAGAFPLAYQEQYKAETAAFDLERLEEVLGGRDLALHLYRPIGMPAHKARFKVYDADEPLPLSEAVPVFENLGFKVVAERPFEIHPAGSERVVNIRDFDLETSDGTAFDPGAVRDRLQETFSRIKGGEVENDGLNRLVLSAQLSWRQVVILRAYLKYLRQARIPFGPDYMVQTLVRNAGIARLLVALFEASFDPAGEDGRTARVAALEEELREAMGQVANLDEDRILKRFANAIQSTLRTNYFQPDASGKPKPYVSFKLDSRALQGLPEPRPLYETWVYSPRVEAIHLRGGKVARGGIRWSDRPEDFRTEILGLMKTQMVKNAVIVPVGAKGGFVVKRPPAERQAYLDEGVACYKTLVRGLLDLADNYKAGEIVTPPHVVRKDELDPYLVVAADKGTATYSDTANGLSAEYGFWLGDAFASGGSAGYDHKVMAITSRGGWESVKRHFREMGRDCQTQDFAVVGVGDMAGDVFGNGMLRSRHIKLFGAFNHVHIFLDPNPDPEKSFVERQRLFDLPRSSWMDYDRSLISAGGGVFERKAKSIPLSSEAADMLGLKAGDITPDELIQALLKAQVDLIWFGGIGTFVKASSESHEQAGDRANDSLRIDATELRCKVIGEGANLALTQKARIEFALHGGRINTDAIDNSGGVDCSDHEVNIKILLNEAVTNGDLTTKQRDVLLEEMTDEVADLVLRDNYLQTQAITVAQAQGPAAFDNQVRLIRELERNGRLVRRQESLPDEDEIAERQAAKKGFTRPELAVLLAYSKITLYEELLASDLPDDPLVSEDLFLYFPKPLRERYPEAIRRHRLRREITATHVTNSMVNRVGPTFFMRMKAATGAAAAEVARAYVQVRDAFELRTVWREIEELDTKVAAEAQTAMILETKEVIERATLWLLRRRFSGSGLGVDTLRGAIETLFGQAEHILPSSDIQQWRKRQRRFERAEVPGGLATRVASYGFLAAALDIAEIAEGQARPVADVGEVYYHVGSRFGFDWLREQAERLPADTSWQREARAELLEELYLQQSRLTAAVMKGARPGASTRAAIDHWSDGRQELVRRCQERISEIKAVGAADLAMLSVARNKLAELVAL